MSSQDFYSASVYAKAILSLKLELEDMKKVISEIITIAEYDISSLNYKVFDQMPLSQITKNFIKVLFEQNKVTLLPQIAKFAKKSFLQNNKVTLVNVSSAKALSLNIENQIQSELQNYFKTDVILQKSIDKNLIDGFTLFFDSYFIDFSKKAKIQKIKSCILQ